VTSSQSAPDVDYLTRDYEGFRRLLISLVDRTGSRWTERAAADIGVMMLEILAYKLDRLAYAGDRVAEEGFLTTARDRESARRHAALGDYTLDRGCATRGYQSFKLRPGKALHLPAGTQVAERPARGQSPDERVVAETLEDADLDARRNELALARSAAVGSALIHLCNVDGSPIDLRAVGVRPGTRLALVDRAQGEVVTVQRAQGHAVELRAPLERTYLAGHGEGAAKVLGNIAPIRRGATRGWELAGHGGAAMDEVPPGELLKRRIAQLRALRDEAEAGREAWVKDRSLASWWELADKTVARVTRELREGGPPAAGSDELKELDEQLRGAADLFRELLRASGCAVPDELQPTRRVPLPRQEIELVSVQPPLWVDDAETLKVQVGVAGRFTPWTRVEDFLRSAPDDRHYIAAIADTGHVSLRFGDGVNGAMLPADSHVIVQRVTGDLFAGDLGVGALETIADDGEVFDPDEPTQNPLPTTGARPPEPLADIELRLQRELAIPIVPVTAADYVELLTGRRELAPDIAEAKVSVARSRVNVVVRPRPGRNPTRVLDKARAFLREARLAGTDVGVRLPEPLFVSLEIIVEIHPEISPADLRSRLRGALLELLGDTDARLLGRPRTRAEIYAAIEKVAGVVWSQVIGFDLASWSKKMDVREEITPALHQIVRCLDLPDSPLSGSIRIWAARRYRLQIEVAYPDPDDRPDLAALTETITALLSGRDAAPLRPEITAARVDEILAQVPPSGAGYRLSTRLLMIGERAVDRVPLWENELPILDSLQIRERLYTPHYGLQIELAYKASPPLKDPEEISHKELRKQIMLKLSGPDSVPVTAAEPWVQIDLARVNKVLRSDPFTGHDYTLTARGITVPRREDEPAPARTSDVPVLGTRRAVDSVPLRAGDVPILDLIQIAATRRTNGEA
jgi:hypothetical protein